MREITSHQVNDCKDGISIHVMDEPGVGGAGGEYLVKIHPSESGPPGNDEREFRISFQNGPIQEVGTNGLTQEVLMAICIDRLQSFQRGPYSCRENALALTKLEEAQHWLHSRTKARRKRGVEGTYEV